METQEEKTGSAYMKCHLLIDDEQYAKEYQRIKREQGREIVEKWTEKTDPTRYVFEDCGILAYILSVKKALNLDISYFADLGCGNGLLPHLLRLEAGIKGCGIDARTRRCWDQFIEAGTDLRKASMDPSDPQCSVIPPETDFLIGNHSDELTPWIPVLAARRKCNFFLLPCCYYDFYQKFINLPTNRFKHGIGVSRYDQYLDYIQSVGTRLGFEMHVDKLKTSSNKRVCFVGVIPPEGLVPNLEETIDYLLTTSCPKYAKPVFKPIGDTVDARNCTQLPWEFKQKLATKMAYILLDLSNEKIGDWQCGGKMHLSELSKHLTDEEKPLLKAQFGGLQTFLKNHSGIFEVRRGIVRMRHWPKESEVYAKKMKTFKKTPCWYFNCHPQGCPVDEPLCPYIHEKYPPPFENDHDCKTDHEPI